MPETTSHQLVVFSLGSEEYALPIGTVHEIIRFSEPRSVASEVPWIRGVIGLRGKIIPIFDLAARMGLEPSEPGKIVIVSSGAGQVGVMVDEVEEVLTVAERPARGRPDRQQRVDRGDRQDRRPPGRPAQHLRAVRPRGRRGARRRGLAMPGAVADTQRVVVADDSRLMRRMLADALGRQGFDVVATAGDGDEALAACREHRPDALTLDLAMPGLDGLGVLRALREGRAAGRVPVVVVSAFSPARGAHAVDALAEGAFDLVAKPTVGQPMDAFATELGRKVGRRRPVRPHAPRARPRAAAPRPRGAAPRGRARPATGSGRAVVIACSTGGPRALAELLPALPSPLGAGVLIVQHMPPGFTASLAGRLDAASPLTVREATGGEALDPAVALLAPGGSHLRVADSRRTELSDAAPEGGLRPRADLTIADVAAPLRRAHAARRADRAWAATASRAPAPSAPPAAACSSRTSRPARSTACRAPSPRPASPTRCCRSSELPAAIAREAA